MHIILPTLLSIFAIVGCLLLGAFMHKRLRDVTKALEKAVAHLEKVEGRIAEQDRAIAALRTQLSIIESNPLGEIGVAAKEFRKKGLMGGLFALGTTLYRAYFKNQRAPKALPARIERKD